MMSVRDIAYVRYEATSLVGMEHFLLDFGLVHATKTDKALYMRARGCNHHVHITEAGNSNRPIGFGFFANSEEALRMFAEFVREPVEHNPEPGGGWRVRTKDPSGFVIDVLYGQRRAEPLPHRPGIAMNFDSSRRRLGQSIRLKPSPSEVLRLGHVAILVPDFQASCAFYRDALGMRPSDLYYAGSETNEIAAFMHCGLGSEWTDHHTIALISSSSGEARFDHSAFEVVDLDDVMQGGQFLRSRGHRHSWGVGRHVQGSQIFDYWRDPFGNKIEHWTDGDLVNDETPVGRTPISDDELKQWAPPLTPEFFE
ncbi:glyoxalase [Burkholderia sp. Bp9140]|uniref:VOC family protein n=1 Tax=Burkholderia sp. Bp9140 TaxID=2184572 RepID=UPI000F571ADE|nr:VOC family protein [Burkholderia sp. Bp9140]RQR51343.1 glyoxalase [Burkholderia sp. Bp9140]